VISGEIDYLSVEDLLEIAAGVLGTVVVRDAGLLAATAARPRMTVFGDDAYPSFEDKAGALLHSLVRNHALIDGNKRLAWSAARIFFLINGRELVYTVDDAEAMMLAAASGELDVPQIASWLVAHTTGAS
jgi:death-on-curing protein